MAVPSIATLPAQFEWSEYEQLMISEAIHRGEMVFNVALRIDQNSGMRAAAFQLIRNVLHGCGTVIALRPEDNTAAANVEIVEAALATKSSQEHIELIAAAFRRSLRKFAVEESSQANTAEHELLGDLWKRKLRRSARRLQTRRKTRPHPRRVRWARPSLPSPKVPCAWTPRASTAVMNLVGELIIGKSMLNRTLTEFDQKFMRAIRFVPSWSTRLLFSRASSTNCTSRVSRSAWSRSNSLFRRFPRVVRDVAKHCGKDVALEVAGQNTDLDKGILDALAEPLTHLVRNAVDHGIESSEDRIAAGKARTRHDFSECLPSGDSGRHRSSRRRPRYRSAKMFASRP